MRMGLKLGKRRETEEELGLVIQVLLGTSPLIHILLEIFYFKASCYSLCVQKSPRGP